MIIFIWSVHFFLDRLQWMIQPPPPLYLFSFLDFNNFFHDYLGQHFHRWYRGSIVNQQIRQSDESVINCGLSRRYRFDR